MPCEILKDRLSLESQIDPRVGKTAQTGKFPYGVLYERNKDAFGNTILKKVGVNTVVVGGAIQSLEHLTNVDANWKPKTLNEIYNINKDVASNNMNSYIALFGVGTGGSGLSFGSIAEKNIKLRDVPNLIPLRTTSLISGDDADKYYFKKDNDDGTYSWYLKEFDVAPVIKTCWKDSLEEDVDGTEVIDEIADSSRTEGLQSFAEFVLSFNTSDVREYYEYIGSLDSALYNSIGLFIGQKVQLPDGSYDYVNVRLFSYLNIDNKSVRVKTASEYVYRILSLT